MQDAWRAYLEMALGLTEAPRKRAQKVAGELVNRGGATAAQVQGLVEDLMSAGMANREALTNLVRYEVERALGAVGLASADEVSALTNRVKDLERRLREAQARAGAPAASVVTGPATGGDRLDKPAPMPAKKTVAKKAVKATPNAMPKAATTPPPAKKAAASPAPAAKKAAASPGPAAKKAAATPAAPAKKAAAPAKKAAKTVPAGPAGTAEAPTAAVKEAAAATELPPARKTAAKKAAAKKVAPAKFIDPGA